MSSLPTTYYFIIVIIKMSSCKMNCGAVHASLCIVNCLQALIDTTNNISPAVSKKKCSGASKCSKKLVEDPNHLLVSFQHHLLLLHVLYPQKLTQLSIKDGCCFFFVLHLFLDFDLFDCCGCGCDS